MKTGSFTISPLSAPEDIDNAVAIWLAGSKRAHHFIDSNYWVQNAPVMKEVYLPQSETWVYKDEKDTMLGFVSLVDNYLASLFVHPDVQSKGIGSRLMEKAKELRDELHLAVYVKNEQAVGFYQKHNFHSSETRIDPNTGEAEFVMVWKNH